MNSRNQLIRKIYRESDIIFIENRIELLGKNAKFDAVTFLNIRLLSTIILFLFVLYNTKIGYIYAPAIAILYYNLFRYVLIDVPIEKRVLKLDHEALFFFEILTLTLESGRNLENSLEVTVGNVKSELSNEFKQALLEIKFGKSLIEALDHMKKRIPSETVNNIILNITQTNVFGNSIIDTMYHQIDFLRDKQVLEIKGQMNKIPNKVSMVSVIFIIPIILILILGPFIINFLG